MTTKRVALFLLLMVCAFSLAAAEAPSRMSADEALARLQRGNARAVKGATIHPNQSLARRSKLASGQQPFAIIVSCSDSRVPPELVFDQGLGDLFVIRVAGNIVDD